MSTSKLSVDMKYIARADEPGFADAFARIESHFFVNKGFMEVRHRSAPSAWTNVTPPCTPLTHLHCRPCQDGELLRQDNIDKIRHIPTSIVQGRYDCVCPATSAYELSQRFPEAKFHLVHAGHSAQEPEIQDVLMRAAEEFAKL